MKMRTKRTKQFRCCLQCWFESPGYLARLMRDTENRRQARLAFMAQG